MCQNRSDGLFPDVESHRWRLSGCDDCYLTESIDEVVLQKSISAQIRQLILRLEKCLQPRCDRACVFGSGFRV